MAGHTGLIGSAVKRKFEHCGFFNVIAASYRDLEVKDALSVHGFIDSAKPEFVVLDAGRVGGIVETKPYSADFKNTNLAIQLNVLWAAHRVPLNLGIGKDFAIRELAESIAGIVGYTVTLEWDTSKPDGTPHKLVYNSRVLTFGWRPSVDLESGLRSTYQWYLDSMLTKGVQL